MNSQEKKKVEELKGKIATLATAEVVRGKRIIFGIEFDECLRDFKELGGLDMLGKLNLIGR